MSKNSINIKTNPAYPMRFQKRDEEILCAIQSYDGVLARRQIKQMFWQEASNQAMERRLSLLFQNKYINWPNIEQRRTRPIPEPIVWLGWRGVLHISQMQADLLPIREPQNEGENQMRFLEDRLRKNKIFWQREPHWSQLSHDIATNDFRMHVEKAVSKLPSMTMELWQTESSFRRDMDIIEYEYLDRKGNKHTNKHGIRPDGFFTLVDHLHQINNSPAKARFLVEYDNSSHPLFRFGKHKALPGLRYIRSKQYKERFGFNSGRWLVICKSEQRMKNLKAQTEFVLGSQASIFLFTTTDQVNHRTVLTSPIWLKGGTEIMEPLVKNVRNVPQ